MCEKGKMPLFRERMNKLYTDSGMKTYGDFAKHIGLTRTSLGYYLSGERLPNADILKQICERCNVSADWLLGLSEVQKPDANVQAISSYTGLNEKAIERLRSLYTSELEIKTIVDTVNVLLNDSKIEGSVIELLDRFLFTDFDDATVFGEHGANDFVKSKYAFFHKTNDEILNLGLPLKWMKAATLLELSDAITKLRNDVNHLEE